MSARDETKHAGELLAGGLLAGVFHLAFLSGRFATEQGRGGLTLLLGCTFITLVLWAMLALRSLAASKPLAPEVDDGLTAAAVTAWALALVPPRAANFLEVGAADDFTRAYLPVSLLAVFVVLAAQALWPRREPRFVWTRWLAALAVSSLALAALLQLACGGDDAAPHALRAAGVGGLAGVAALLSARASGAAPRPGGGV